jgi:very-short-patch-repair endonuclease
MDFLLLLPQGRRVVLEVDGAHHYAGSGNYTAGVRGDRDLKLSGYEVFRFSSTELSDIDQARLLLREFFARLFDHYEVTLPQR